MRVVGEFDFILVGGGSAGCVLANRLSADPQLRLRGVERLRVIDASVMPSITSGNINAPVMMIAETGAEMVMRRGL